MKSRNVLTLLLAGISFSLAAQSPALLDVQVKNLYKYRSDATPGRVLQLSYRGSENLTTAKVEIFSKHGNETLTVEDIRNDSIPVYLSPQIGVEQTDTIVVTLDIGTRLSREVVVPKMRHWTVYIYPHSHVDIGYTNTQANCEFIHKRNLDVAMDLIEKTSSYPEDARFRWNPEVTWPVERYLATEPKEKKERLMKFIKNGSISIDAGYISTNTSAASDEELLHLFEFGKKMEKESGRSVKTMVQVDVPGMSWGVVSAARQMGIENCISFYNGFDRVGLALENEFQPYWWEGPSGEKVFFLQTDSYNPGARFKGMPYAIEIMGQTDRTKIMPFVKTDNPRAHFIDPYLDEQLPELEKRKDYPYSIFPMTWAMADNTPVDVDLPEAVKSWNEDYAFPHLKICTATEMAEAFTKNYADQIPTRKGDYTEYWTDGLGSAAKQTGMGREVKERLIQAEILWSIMNPKKELPDDFSEAWRHILLSTEHTWMFSDPYKEPISREILQVKFGYFEKACELTEKMLQEAVQSVTDSTSNRFMVFNTNTWPQTQVVYLTKEQAGENNQVLDAQGKEVLSQRLATGELAFLATDVPGLGSSCYTLSKVEKTNSSNQNTNITELDNGLVKVKVDPMSGDIVSLQLEGEEYVDSSSASAINSFRYLKGNDTQGRATKAYDNKIFIQENGPLVYSLLVRSKAESCNKLVREVRLVKGSSVVELNNVVDKQANLNKEGVHFGFAFQVSGGITKVNIPWGIMELEKDQLPNANRNWMAMQRWLDVSNEQKGITFCSLNASCFESGDMTANVLGSATYYPWIRKLQPSSTFYSWALNNHWHTNFQLSQKGEIPFKYRLAPHKKGFDSVAAVRFGLEQFRPLVVVQTSVKEKPVQPRFSLNDPEVYLSTFKPLEKGKYALIRLYNIAESTKSNSIIWNGKQPKHCYRMIGNDKYVQIDLTQVEVPAKGIATYKIEW